MIVHCTSCKTPFRLAPQQVQGRKRVRVRCTKCGTVFEPAEVASLRDTAIPPTIQPRAERPRNEPRPAPRRGGPGEITGFLSDAMADESSPPANQAQKAKEESVSEPDRVPGGGLLPDPGDTAAPPQAKMFARASAQAPTAQRIARPPSALDAIDGNVPAPRPATAPGSAPPSDRDASAGDLFAGFPEDVGSSTNDPTRVADLSSLSGIRSEPAPAKITEALPQLANPFDVLDDAYGARNDATSDEDLRPTSHDPTTVASATPTTPHQPLEFEFDDDAPFPFDADVPAKPTDAAAPITTASHTSSHTASRPAAEHTNAPNQDPTALVVDHATGKLRNGRAGPVWATLFFLLVGVVSFSGFVAYHNDGTLDFKNLRHALAVAVQGETYAPRHIRYVEAIDANGVPVGDTWDALPEYAQAPLVVSNLMDRRYDATNRQAFLLIEGSVRNQSNDTYRRVSLHVTWTDDSGATVHQMDVPAGSEVDQGELEAIARGTPEALTEIYRDIAERAADLLIEPGQQTRFTAVVALESPDAFDGLHYTARIDHAERRDEDTCWHGFRFETERTLAAANAPTPDPMLVGENDARDAPSESAEAP